jgi:hypothetical protein
MNRSGWWIAVAAAAWLVLACDPKTPKPTEPPKPIAGVMSSPHADDLVP